MNLPRRMKVEPDLSLVRDKVLVRCGLGNEYRNSILMMHHFSDLGSASDWLK